MDYIETFKNLKTNNKWGRKSSHKAVLMLTVIEMYEKNILTDNEIPYDETLKTTFLKVWNRVLPDEPLFHSEAYLPFWYLQSDSFWHIIPVRGKEDILSLMRDNNLKPSEAKLSDSVKYAELDEDLYFLMTLPSGRSSLKMVLLENYTSLSNKQIEMLAESKDNTIDYSESALFEYENILKKNKKEDSIVSIKFDNELVSKFQYLEEDVQLTLYIVYYTFLKKHHNEREMFKEVCPTVYDLLDKIVYHPVKQGDVNPTFAFTYENFLCDLRIALMSESGSMELIDKIGNAITILRGYDIAGDSLDKDETIDATEAKEEKESILVENKGYNDSNLEVEHVYLDSNYNDIKSQTSSLFEDSPNEEPVKESRKGRAWTKEEEDLLTQYFQRGNDTADIAEIFGRTEVAIKLRLAKLGLIEYTYGQDEAAEKKIVNTAVDIDDFKIENSLTRCYILNKNGEKVFSADGKLKFIKGKLYRLNLKKECFTIKDMQFNGEVWIKGDKKIVAYPRTKLYCVMDFARDYFDEIEDIDDSPVFQECRLKVKDEWYNCKGELEIYEKSNSTEKDTPSISDNNKQRIIKHPLYESRKQALLRALGYFRFPAKIKDISRTISRTAWGAPIKEEDVEDVINTIKEIESVEGNYILRKR